MEKEIKLLRDELSNEKSSTSTKSSERDDLVCKIDAMTVTMTTYENQISALEQNNSSLQHTIAELTNEKRALQETLQNTKKQTEEGTKEMDDLKTQIEELQKSLHSAQKVTYIFAIECKRHRMNYKRNAGKNVKMKRNY